MNFKNLDFIAQRNKFFMLSGIIIILGIICLSIFGMNLGIDFSKGSRVDIQGDESLSIEKVNATFEKLNMEPSEPIVTSGTNSNVITARFNQAFNKGEVANIQDAIKEEFGIKPSISTVSPQVGRMQAKNAFWAIMISALFIIVYVSIRFEFLQGVAAIVALFHDAFLIIAVFSLFHIEVNIVFIAAVLTIVGYSINDTIVTFDRIREQQRLNKKKKLRTFADFKSITNVGIQQTFRRSINTSLTTTLAVLALLFFGATSIWTFSLALLIGLISGAYSSIFIAAPLWVLMKVRWSRHQGKKKQAQPQTET